MTGIPTHVTMAQLKMKFGRAGSIYSAKLKYQYQKDILKKGRDLVTHQTAFILFENVEAAQKSIDMFNLASPFTNQ